MNEKMNEGVFEKNTPFLKNYYLVGHLVGHGMDNGVYNTDI